MARIKLHRMSGGLLALYAVSLCSDMGVSISELRKMLHTTAGGRAILRRINRQAACILLKQAEACIKQKSMYRKHERWRCNARRCCAHGPR